MEQSPRIDRALAIPSTAISTAETGLDSHSDFNSSEINKEVTEDTPSLADHAGYEGINWTHLPGFCIRQHRKRLRMGWVWEHGYNIENERFGRRFWLCRECHLKKARTMYMYDAASISQANGHMESAH
ncbi:hypothetical protein BGZ63DRAFT_429545 [Mariannaea sp. PMI_226]|nr:hypothetical protein BGZ63DRAFT_429545 [Mariannaea sp. PMI_226]